MPEAFVFIKMVTSNSEQTGLGLAITQNQRILKISIWSTL